MSTSLCSVEAGFGPLWGGFSSRYELKLPNGRTDCHWRLLGADGFKSPRTAKKVRGNALLPQAASFIGPTEP